MRPHTRKIDKTGWTLEKRRMKTDRVRLMKRSFRHTDLITRLQIVTNMPTSERLREMLTANIQALVEHPGGRWYETRQRDWLDIKSVNWTTDTVWALLPLEKNKKVLKGLLRLATKIIHRSPFFYSERGQQRTLPGAVTAALSLLEQELTSVHRDLAFKVLEMGNSYIWSGYMCPVAEERRHRILRVCLLNVQHYATFPITSPMAVASIMRLLTTGVCVGNADSSVAIDAILDNEYMLPFIFEGLRSTEGFLQESFFMAIDTILAITQPASRVTLLIRHFKDLQETLILFLNDPCCMRHDVLSYCFLEYQEFAAIIATNRSILELLISKMSWTSYDGECRWDALWCTVMVYVMDSVLENDRMLQAILGYGVLIVAKPLSRRLHLESDYRTEIFREILERHPEWRRRFREWTQDAEAGSATARVARSFPIKDRLGRVDYIFEDEDDSDF